MRSSHGVYRRFRRFVIFSSAMILLNFIPGNNHGTAAEMTTTAESEKQNPLLRQSDLPSQLQGESEKLNPGLNPTTIGVSRTVTITSNQPNDLNGIQPNQSIKIQKQIEDIVRMNEAIKARYVEQTREIMRITQQARENQRIVQSIKQRDILNSNAISSPIVNGAKRDQPARLDKSEQS